MDLDYSLVIIFMELIIIHGKELTKTYQQENTSSGFRDVNDFFEKASHEAVTIMVFFQILSISFLVYKFSSFPNLVIWLSIVFVMYTLTGPYFCLKWLLVVSSFIWHILVLLWTHPYFIASCFIVLGIFKLARYVLTQTAALEGEVSDIKSVLIKLDSVEEKTQELTNQLAHLSEAVIRLEEQMTPNKDINESIQERVDDDVAYPLDRRRHASMMSRR